MPLNAPTYIITAKYLAALFSPMELLLLLALGGARAQGMLETAFNRSFLIST